MMATRQPIRMRVLLSSAFSMGSGAGGTETGQVSLSWGRGSVGLGDAGGSVELGGPGAGPRQAAESGPSGRSLQRTPDHLWAVCPQRPAQQRLLLLLHLESDPLLGSFLFFTKLCFSVTVIWIYGPLVTPREPGGHPESETGRGGRGASLETRGHAFPEGCCCGQRVWGPTDARSSVPREPGISLPRAPPTQGAPPHHGVQVELSLPLPLLLAPQTHVEQWDLLGGPWAGLQNQ